MLTRFYVCGIATRRSVAVVPAVEMIRNLAPVEQPEGDAMCFVDDAGDLNFAVLATGARSRAAFPEPTFREVWIRCAR